MNLFDEIQKYYGHSFNSSDFQMIEALKKDYTDDEIIQLFKDYPGKPISYLFKVKPTKKAKPEWFGKDIQEELLTRDEIIPILKEWRQFFDDEDEYKQWCKKQLDYIEERK